VKDAELHADDDKLKKEKITAFNELDNLVYQSEKMIKDNEADLSSDDKSKLTKEIEAAKVVLQNKDASVDEFKKVQESLMQANHTASSSLYEKQRVKSESAGSSSGSEQASSSGSSSSNDDDVIDADYKDV
ncbi:MAG: Hsp70 family protein, partial [Bdellovibrionales bacterium]|nr:Hsp70 family protein [Bdellovibrionales bacterium]